MPWIDNARILAIFAVVVLHTCPWVFNVQPVGSVDWWFAVLYHSACRWAVPLLVMLSGVLLLDPARQEPAQLFYRRRLARLLWPTLFWSAFFLAWTAAKSHWQGQPVPPQQLVDALLAGRPYYHLWFLFMIAGLYALTPLLRPRWQRCSLRQQQAIAATSLAAAAFYTGWRALHPGGAPETFLHWTLQFLPYYLAGPVWLASVAHSPSARLLTLFVLSVLATAAGLYSTHPGHPQQPGLYFDSAFSVTVIPMAATALLLLSRCRRPWLGRHTASVASLSFGVYLMHPAMQEVLAFLGLRPSLGPAVLVIPLLSLTIFAATLCASWLLARLPVTRRLV